jgi:hypothetical protein
MSMVSPIDQTPRFRRNKTCFQIRLDERLARRLYGAARLRKTTPTQLLNLIAHTVLDADLVEAVIDDKAD